MNEFLIEFWNENYDEAIKELADLEEVYSRLHAPLVTTSKTFVELDSIISKADCLDKNDY